MFSSVVLLVYMIKSRTCEFVLIKLRDREGYSDLKAVREILILPNGTDWDTEMTDLV